MPMLEIPLGDIRNAPDVKDKRINDMLITGIVCKEEETKKGGKIFVIELTLAGGKKERLEFTDPQKYKTFFSRLV